MQLPQPHDSRSLALACSALARAGQALSTATTSTQARSALRMVADQLAADRNLAALVPTEEIAKKCREAADGQEDAATISACRQVATQLARRASALASEIQQKPATPAAPRAVPATPAAPPAAPVPAAEPVPAPPPSKPVPPAPATTPAAPEVVPPTVPLRSATAPKAQPPATAPVPRVDPAQVQRVSVARSAAERQAVTSALETGRRFAIVGNGTLIDVRTNRMWTAHLTQGATHAEAIRLASACDLGGGKGWRLPQPSELSELLSDNGLQALRAAGSLPATGAALLWSAEVRSRFFGFLKDALAAQSATGDLVRQSLKNNTVQALFVRN